MAVYKSKSPTKDGRAWYFRIYKNGKQFESQKYFTKKEALAEEGLFKLHRDNPIKKPFSIVALGYFKDLEKTKKPSTVYTYQKDYKKHLEPFFNKYELTVINVQIIKNWATEMENKGISVAYMNKCRNILKGIFNYAIKNFGYDYNPVEIYGTFQKKNDQIITDEEKIRYITKEEFDKFIQHVDDEMWKTFFITAFYTGCRKGEMQALNWHDIDFDNNLIIINKTLYEVKKGTPAINSTKNNLNRKIKMSKTLSNALLDHKHKMMKYSNFSEDWFVFGNIMHLHKTNIERYKHYYFVLSGVHEITMHEFRHSHVSLLINEYVKNSREKNMKIDTAKFFLMMSSRMGHTIDVMQKTYMHLFPTIQDEIVDLLNNL